MTDSTPANTLLTNGIGDLNDAGNNAQTTTRQRVPVDSSSQIGLRSTNVATTYVITHGWYDDL